MERESPVWGEDWARVRSCWLLDPEVAHCNHGAYGAVPRPVLDAQDVWRQRMHANPVRFFSRDLMPAVLEARDTLARYVGADLEGSALVVNATTAMATVLGSLDLQGDDEVLVTDHAYGAVRMAVEGAARVRGFRVAVAEVPLAGDDDVWLDRVLGRVTARTRVAVIDHVTSSTARLVPVRELVSRLQERGVLVVVDASHVPGLLDTDVVALGADFWFGNFHKWAYAPAGAALLWVAPPHRVAMRSPVVSWLDDLGYPSSVMGGGTRDVTAWLAAPRGLEFIDELGPARLRRHNLDLAAQGQRRVADATGLDITGLDDVPLPMRVLPLPPHTGGTDVDSARVQARIATELGVETGVQAWNGRLLLRLSAQAYNHPDDYARLAAGLPGLLR